VTVLIAAFCSFTTRLKVCQEESSSSRCHYALYAEKGRSVGVKAASAFCMHTRWKQRMHKTKYRRWPGIAVVSCRLRRQDIEGLCASVASC
jgi:hypothetical protein